MPFHTAVCETDESVRSNRIRHERPIAVFTMTILLVAAFGAVLAYRYYDNGITSIAKTPSGVSSLGSVTPSSSTTTMSTISISNSTGLASIWIAEATATLNGSGIDFEFPTLDSKTGQIYALTATACPPCLETGTNRLLTSFNTTSLVYRTVQAVPGTGIGLAVDPTTDEIYVAVAPTPCSESAPNNCYSNQGEVLRVNGSTGAIEGEIPISTYGFGVSVHGFGIGINSNTDTLFALERCPVANTSSPCGRLLTSDPETGSLMGTVTLKANFGDFVVDSITNTLYIAADWEVQTAHANSTSTQGIIAVDTRNLTVKFLVPLNYTGIIDTSIDESTNTPYGIADNTTGNMSSVYLFSISGNSGSVLLSVVVGNDCWVYGGMTVNTSTNQVYLYAGHPPEESIVILDGVTGHVVGMLPSGAIQKSIFDPIRDRVYVIFPGVVIPDTAVAIIPSAVMEGNVNPAILNATCPPIPPPLG